MYKVLLSNVGNPDLRQDPNRSLPGTPKPQWVNVRNLWQASQKCTDYIRKYDLGSGNWTGGMVVPVMEGGQTGSACVRVAYTGKIFDENNVEILPPVTSRGLTKLTLSEDIILVNGRTIYNQGDVFYRFSAGNWFACHLGDCAFLEDQFSVLEEYYWCYKNSLPYAEVIDYLRRHGKRVAPGEDLPITELMMDNHICISFAQEDWYLHREAASSTESDERIFNFLREAFNG